MIELNYKLKRRWTNFIISLFIINSICSSFVFLHENIYGVVEFVFAIVIILILILLKENWTITCTLCILLGLHFFLLLITADYSLVWLLQIILSFLVIFILSRIWKSYKLIIIPVFIHGGFFVYHLNLAFDYYHSHSMVYDMTFHRSLWYTYFFETWITYITLELSILSLSIFVPVALTNFKKQ